MKYTYCIVILLFALLLNIYAQVTLEEKQRQHVYMFAADSLIGRKDGSQQAKIVAGYITAQWKEIGKGYTHRIAFTDFLHTKNADGAHIRNRALYFTLGFSF